MARVHRQRHCHRREGVGEGHVIVGERERVSTLLSVVGEKAGTRVSHRRHWGEGEARARRHGRREGEGEGVSLSSGRG